MPIALDDDHRALADTVTALAARHAPLEQTRKVFDDLAAGEKPAVWDELVRAGLHTIHLPEEYGGADASLTDLAVVAEQLGRALVPGPWLPTVTTGAVLATLEPTGPVPALLRALGAGAGGALVTTPGLTATATDAGWTVTGTCGPVLGLPGADTVIVRADLDGAPLWFRLPARTGEIIVDEGTDLTRSVGRLRLHDDLVTHEDAVPAPDPDRVDLIVNTLLAAEASGVAGWALATAVDYVRDRVQFGRPVGTFQAVQHKAAMMLVHTETACAAAWDAARAAGHSTEQIRLAAAHAALTALPAGIDVTHDCVMLLGGIGFTWEHDAHLYWRRAVSIASIGGPDAGWARRLGAAALTDVRDYSFVEQDALPQLRARVAPVLEQVAALPETGTSDEDDDRPVQEGGPRRELLAEAGLVAPHYPAPYGLGAGPVEQAVIADEFARHRVKQPTTVIGEWVLPTLLVHGTAAQQQRFIGPTLRGEFVWCQLFSEPGAGSDLASLTTRARKVDGGWSLSGQKVWNSKAHEADFGVCLARTDRDAPKHKGISYFLVDMRSAGVQVRPLRQATGRAEFNEVFLDNVFVPDDCLVGGPGDGWRLAVTTLSNERLNMGAMLTHGSARRVRELIDSGQYVAERDDAIRVLGRDTGREMTLSAMNLRNVLGRMSDADVGAEISVQKLYNALVQRDGARALLSLLGPAAAIADGGGALDYIGVPAVLFGGGTVEIQLNVIAQRVLGLPR
ncbi:acyl-CoA dehydrogenase [Nocardia vermiculata]|uniref:Acyl-CoA dehydrogenase n=1 Tax=Nocardia vermiculata TaxID=257274 RepID=A0A846YAM1_9NOCA|nr:acyl-CoA dehydrogenase [Nocardia vermiculata]NKY53819.1 acyl-CoA dehydrogenase [Nocardia vermiculata]